MTSSSMQYAMNFKNITILPGQAGVANAGYVQLAHLVMDSQKISFIKTQTQTKSLES